MLYNIDGINFRNLLDYGIRSLAVYKDKVNALNVFPVPDGDTGTNMLLTLQNGYEAISETEASLGETARSFSRAIVFGARGNSGVIVSQFFRGLCESLYDKETADFCELVSAFENGVVSAYKSVSKPVEGTILTVIREAIEHVRKELDDYRLDSVNEVISAFIDKAKSTLNNTPNMLAVLKSANVVDSGGAGIIYVFEGMRCYLDGKPLPIYEHNQPSAAKKANDFSKFNKNSLFEYGYCTELLIQLTFRADSFSVSAFRDELSELGDSIVVSYEDDKVKLHIHTFAPEKVLAHCHTYGEFLSLKIENMSV
ncbi:MAG: DAK2 domain-containing protein, partial [Clostridia bacterium]|nr:DAK2 domain-containing protein [Clostridia bacterium]